MKVRAAIFALSTVAIAASCTEGPEWRGTVTDSSGVVIVSNPAEGLWAPGEAWTLREELRIGALEGDPAYQFGQIGVRGIAVGSDERLYVLDAMAGEIRVFGPDGSYERSIGQAGAGPGEIGPGANFLLMARGDTVLLPDLANQRITWYSADGSAFGSSRLSLTDGVPLVFTATASGVVVGQLRPLTLPGQVEEGGEQDAVVTMSAEGVPLDTLMLFESGKTFSLGGARPEVKIFSAEPAWDVTDKLRVIYGMNDVYRIGVYGADGELTRVITKPFERRPVGERDKTLVLDFIVDAWRAAGLSPEELQLARGIVSFGEYYPAFGRIAAGPAGTIWVQQMAAPADMSEEELADYNFLEDAGSSTWDVFEEGGRYLGAVAFPPRFQPRIFLGSKVYGVWRDELDVQYVMRLGLIGLDA